MNGKIHVTFMFFRTKGLTSHERLFVRLLHYISSRMHKERKNTNIYLLASWTEEALVLPYAAGEP